MAEFFAQYSGYLFAAVTVVAALLIFVLIYRALGGKVRGRRGQRLGISEYYEVDKTRRLILVRRDDTEHLVLIGGSGDDVVIETGITGESGYDEASAFRRAMKTEQREDAPQRPAPRPAVFGDRVPARGVRRAEPRLAASRDDA